MKKKLLFCFISFIFLFIQKPQAQTGTQALLFVEDFDVAGGNGFQLNAPGMNPYGTNKWKINNVYSGVPGVASYTPSQIITTGSLGIIGTPNGKYMHIQNFNLSVADANFDPAADAEQLTKMKTGFCTFGYSEILMTFWWTCKGGPNAYGEVYFSIDGGTTWIRTKNTDGDSIYNGKDVWKYTVINQPEFLNRLDLRFGFKWHNVGAALTDTLPFAIDDVIIVGKTDSVHTPTITSSFIFPNPLCQMYPQPVTFYFTPSDTLCVGDYEIQISDSSCNWSNPTTIGYLNGAGPFYPVFYGASGTLPIPTTIPQGHCYCWRMNRVSPAPAINGIIQGGSNCFVIGDCPETITTLQPAVLKDPLLLDSAGLQHICIQSVVDCPFYSYGAYNPPNIYNLELSDSAGNFVPLFTNIGTLPDFTTWDPALPPPPMKPGSVSGKIPKKDANNNDIKPGCNYYIRVSSTDPLVHGTPWGPFCIDECDIESNQTIDITCCVTNTQGCIDTLDVLVHMFDSTITYALGDSFIYQILDSKTMAIVYQGNAFGFLKDTTTGKFVFNIPNLPFWLSKGLALKMYYMRIIATGSSDTTTNYLGTLIRITVSGISGSPLTITGPPQTLCGSKDLLTLTLSPYTPTSKYIWTFQGVGSTQPLPGASQSFNISFLTSGTYQVTVTEVGGANCVGPASAPFLITILGQPDVTINGDLNVCVGDTATYSCNFEAATYYQWGQTGGKLVDSANNQIRVVWTTVGNGTVSLYALGYCGSSNNLENITVLPRPILTCKDTFICKGQTAKLVVTSDHIGTTYTWYKNDTTLLSVIDTLTVTPDSSTTYLIKGDYFGCVVKKYVTVHVLGNAKDYTYTVCWGDTIHMNVGEGNTFAWSPFTYLSNPAVFNPICAPQLNINYTVIINNNNPGCPIDTAHVTVLVANAAACSAGADQVIILGSTTTLMGCAGATAYSWSPGAGLSDSTIANPTASPTVSTTYRLTVVDPTGCKAIDTVVITVVPQPNIAVPNAFTPNGDGQNDVFLPKAAGVKTVEEFSVYNRWGERVFTSTDITQGWDGLYKGVPEQLGTYVYYIKAVMVDDNTRIFKGNFMLIR